MAYSLSAKAQYTAVLWYMSKLVTTARTRSLFAPIQQVLELEQWKSIDESQTDTWLEELAVLREGHTVVRHFRQNHQITEWIQEKYTGSIK